MADALESIRVVEVTEALAGPYCAMLLGDLGADVVKVERPEIGDQSRGWGPPFYGGESTYYLATNRNKRSITINFKQPKGLELLKKLIAGADVFINNQFSAASLQKRGLDAATLRAENPHLIYCAISGYGFTGPKAGRPSYDILAQAESGIMSFTGEPGSGPLRYPIAIADMTCGIYSAMGILAALFSREKTGQGQFLDMSLFDSQLTWLSTVGSSYLNGGSSPRRWGNAHPNIVPYDVFSGSDGSHLVIGIGTESLWQKLAAILDAETCDKDSGAKLSQCELFLSNAMRNKNREVLIPRLQKVFAQRPAAAWLERFEQAGIPAAAINTVPDALGDAQARARGSVVQIEHPALGNVGSIANPIKFSGTPITYRYAPPLLGQHTGEILEELKCSSDEIEELQKQHAI